MSPVIFIRGNLLLRITGKIATNAKKKNRALKDVVPHGKTNK